jgi:hypothetical protein
MKSVMAKKSVIRTTAEVGKPESKKKEEPEIRVLKSETCPSLSGNSKLTYEVGLNEAKDLCLRITANTKAGAFCTDTTELKTLRAALDRAPRNETITSAVFRHLYAGSSENMSGFIFSVLLHEGLVRRSLKEKERRRYERVEPEAFDAAVKALMEGKGASANADAKASKAKGTKVVATKPKNDKKSSKLS